MPEQNKRNEADESASRCAYQLEVAQNDYNEHGELRSVGDDLKSLKYGVVVRSAQDEEKPIDPQNNDLRNLSKQMAPLRWVG